MKVRGRGKITDHPSKTGAKPGKAQNFSPALVRLCRFVKATPWLTGANRNVKGNAVLAPLFSLKEVHIHLQETSKLIRHISAVCKAKAEVFFATQTQI